MTQGIDSEPVSCAVQAAILLKETWERSKEAEKVAGAAMRQALQEEEEAAAAAREASSSISSSSAFAAAVWFVHPVGSEEFVPCY